jgi:hypothetical protein
MAALVRATRRLLKAASVLVAGVCLCLAQSRVPRTVQEGGTGAPCTFNFEKLNMPDCIRTNAEGKLYVSPKYLRELRFGANGLAALSAEGLGWIYVNHAGQVVLKGVAPFDNGADEFHSGLVRVLRNDKFGFADRTGKLVIPAEYDGALQFKRGTAVVCRQCRTDCDEYHEHCWFVGGKWSRIGTRGRVIARCLNDYCR